MDIVLLLLVTGALFLGVVAGMTWAHWRNASTLQTLVLRHEAEIAEVLLGNTALVGAKAVEDFRATLWHEWKCPGPHDYPREPDFRKGKWLQYHCIRCGAVLWREKTQGTLGMKQGG